MVNEYFINSEKNSKANVRYENKTRLEPKMQQMLLS